VYTTYFDVFHRIPMVKPSTKHAVRTMINTGSDDSIIMVNGRSLFYLGLIIGYILLIFVFATYFKFPGSQSYYTFDMESQRFVKKYCWDNYKLALKSFKYL